MVFAHLCQGERPRGPAPGTGPAHLAAGAGAHRHGYRSLPAGGGRVPDHPADPGGPARPRPPAPPPQRRLEAMRALAEAGIPTGVLLAPVLPGITDGEEQLAAVVAAAKEYGASALFTNTLHLGEVTKQAFFEYLEHKRPELVPEYERLYRGKYAPRAPRQGIQQVVAALRGHGGFAGLPRRAAPPSSPLTRAEFARPTQLRLL